MPQILDVSAYQPNVNWSEIKQDGVVGVWIKATEGLTYNSPTYRDQVAGARKAGLRVGAYHFARPDSHPFDPTAEARHFATIIGRPQRRDLRPVLDFETPSKSLTAAQLEAWCRTFCQEVKRRTGVLPVFYTFSAFISSYLPHLTSPIGAALWLANYGPNDGKEHIVAASRPWKNVQAHQYTSKAQLRGIPGRVDMSSARTLRPLLAYPVKGLV